MSEIKAGDLVMVVRPQPCCGNTGHLGRIHAVGDIALCAYTCSACLTKGVGKVVILHDSTGWLLSCVRKMEPGEEPEAIETDLEVTA